MMMMIECRVRTWKAVNRPGRLVPDRGRGRTALFAEGMIAMMMVIIIAMIVLIAMMMIMIDAYFPTLN